MCEWNRTGGFCWVFNESGWNMFRTINIDVCVFITSVWLKLSSVCIRSSLLSDNEIPADEVDTTKQDEIRNWTLRIRRWNVWDPVNTLLILIYWRQACFSFVLSFVLKLWDQFKHFSVHVGHVTEEFTTPSSYFLNRVMNWCYYWYRK